MTSDVWGLYGEAGPGDGKSYAQGYLESYLELAIADEGGRRVEVGNALKGGLQQFLVVFSEGNAPAFAAQAVTDLRTAYGVQSLQGMIMQGVGVVPLASSNSDLMQAALAVSALDPSLSGVYAANPPVVPDVTAGQRAGTMMCFVLLFFLFGIALVLPAGYYWLLRERKARESMRQLNSYRLCKVVSGKMPSAKCVAESPSSGSTSQGDRSFTESDPEEGSAGTWERQEPQAKAAAAHNIMRAHYPFAREDTQSDHMSMISSVLEAGLPLEPVAEEIESNSLRQPQGLSLVLYDRDEEANTYSLASPASPGPSISVRAQHAHAREFPASTTAADAVESPSVAPDRKGPHGSLPKSKYSFSATSCAVTAAKATPAEVDQQPEDSNRDDPESEVLSPSASSFVFSATESAGPSASQIHTQRMRDRKQAAIPSPASSSASSTVSGWRGRWGRGKRGKKSKLPAAGSDVEGQSSILSYAVSSGVSVRGYTPPVIQGAARYGGPTGSMLSSMNGSSVLSGVSSVEATSAVGEKRIRGAEQGEADSEVWESNWLQQRSHAHIFNGRQVTPNAADRPPQFFNRRAMAGINDPTAGDTTANKQAPPRSVNAISTEAATKKNVPPLPSPTLAADYIPEPPLSMQSITSGMFSEVSSVGPSASVVCAQMREQDRARHQADRVHSSGLGSDFNPARHRLSTSSSMVSSATENSSRVSGWRGWGAKRSRNARKHDSHTERQSDAESAVSSIVDKSEVSSLNGSSVLSGISSAAGSERSGRRAYDTKSTTDSDVWASGWMKQREFSHKFSGRAGTPPSGGGAGGGHFPGAR
jgi:hypothetical protein